MFDNVGLIQTVTAIELTDVTKRYGDETALSGLDLGVKEGEIYGFLGPNGAGKSTTINLILDFVRPTSGEVRVFGHDAQTEGMAIRRRTGILPEGFSLYDRLTGRQHLEFATESKGIDADVDALFERVGLGPDAPGKKVGGYSKGMAQRLALAAAIAGEPDLLILDEPSTGLDPAGARQMRDIIRAERDRGATIFFSSHILEQVDAVCDRVGILRDGQLVAEDTVEGLRDATTEETTLVVELDHLPEGATEQVAALEGVSNVTTRGTVATVTCRDDVKSRVIRAFEEAGATVEDFETEESSLEDLFIDYTTGATA
ncbi:ABC transporter-like protein [Halalkalicoccus jeotgali B3]|uniref:ABC transporter-like protein n=1 Tax=Halalkalicoccus jeotgali (strain DSM 18796 / CECT 7217 / JCM 14584 / KCTC 4019 / B3) TaxID=795797 RepID=L9VAJ2_HALJB|nr:ABC transporter-like protein [Halalkalicoccus jeotgali B3]